MQSELPAAFSKPSTSAKFLVASCLYKVPNDLFQAFVKAPKVEEEMTKAVGATHPFPMSVNPDVRKTVETFYILLNGHLTSWMAHNFVV